MRPCVVVKWGGGLITNKSTMKTVNAEVIDALAEEVRTVINNGVDVLLVHGAGSFGHLRAKQYRLADGHIEGFNDGEMTQGDAVKAVQQDMLELNDRVMDALTAHDVSAVRWSPHRWVNGTGLNFNADLEVFRTAPHGIVVVTYGDVVPCEPPRMFGILSGDDLVARLAKEVERVTRVVFAMGGVDGVLRSPPVDGFEQDLIEVLTPSTAFEGEHAAHMDVTGGIGLKVHRGFEAARDGCEVILVNGEVRGRLADACLGNSVVGTSLLADER